MRFHLLTSPQNNNVVTRSWSELSKINLKIAIGLATKIENSRKKYLKKSGYSFYIGFALSQATKALRESRGIALLYFRRLH